MTIMIIYVILSFLLDGLLSNYFSTFIVDPSYLRTIYSVISLVIIFPYFENKKKYFYILISLGILFDIVYTNTFILNIVLFLLIYIFLNIIDYYLPYNLFTINLRGLLAITIYHIFSYLILLFSHYNNYSFNLFILILSRSIIMTIIYATISYLVIKKIYYQKDNRLIK